MRELSIPQGGRKEKIFVLRVRMEICGVCGHLRVFFHYLLPIFSILNFDEREVINYRRYPQLPQILTAGKQSMKIPPLWN